MNHRKLERLDSHLPPPRLIGNSQDHSDSQCKNLVTGVLHETRHAQVYLAGRFRGAPLMIFVRLWSSRGVYVRV